MNQVKGVIFDFAGTTIDYGCFAPLKGFIDGFASKNVSITPEEARGPMGLLKVDHIRALTAIPHINKELQNNLGHSVTDDDVMEIYHVFEDVLLKNLVQYSDIKPFVVDCVDYLREKGIKIGSTSGYTREMMDFILPEVREKGYSPDYTVCADEVTKGRPAPYMIWQNMNALQIDNPRQVVKVGDTVADIKEGLSAETWTVGVVMGSSEMGLTEEEEKSLPKEELAKRKDVVKQRFYKAGADYIIDDLSELPNVIEKINDQLAEQEDHKLLTPGPLTTRKSVKLAQLADHCTWDDDYKKLTISVMNDITDICANTDEYATVLLQGSGSYAVEAMIQTFCKDDEKLLIVENGAYGKRMVKQAELAHKNYCVLSFDMCSAIDPEAVKNILESEPSIKTVMFVHSETTSGVINPIKEIASIAKAAGKTVLVDTMSSFAAYETNMKEWGIDALAASANKCLEGLPGLSFVIARKDLFEAKSNSKSLCLDLCDQYKGLYPDGKFRFTSPTTILLALRRAIDLYKMEGGLAARKERYAANHKVLMEETRKLGIKAIVDEKYQSYIITTFALEDISFEKMYTHLKKNGFVIYPGKLTDIPTFRIGTIGDIYPSDIKKLCDCIKAYKK
ncbi:MAG: 2-aminoethylphosphonate--pyruvate transaminase [Fibrobacteraceae bacterium]|nr:2-aminoethylphosphonate--pyruvate transaminase [Fibrobacteraceae bacterium]